MENDDKSISYKLEPTDKVHMNLVVNHIMPALKILKEAIEKDLEKTHENSC